MINTSFFRGWPAPARFLMRFLFATPAEGARPLVKLAVDESVEGKMGVCFDKLVEKAPSAAARDDASARRLWEYSEQLSRPA